MDVKQKQGLGGAFGDDAERPIEFGIHHGRFNKKQVERLEMLLTKLIEREGGDVTCEPSLLPERKVSAVASIVLRSSGVQVG